MFNNKLTYFPHTFTCIVLLTLFAGYSANAQLTPDRPLSWGLKAGINATTLYGDDIDNADVVAGFNGGIFLNYRFKRHWSVQPEVLFSMKGADVDNGILGSTGTTEFEFGYVDIPVLLKYHIPTRSKLIPNLYLGPQVGFNVYGDANDEEIDESMEDTEFSLAFGGGADWDVASSSNSFIQLVGIDLRYTLGLTDVFDVTGDPEAKNGVFTGALTVGF